MDTHHKILLLSDVYIEFLEKIFYSIYVCMLSLLLLSTFSILSGFQSVQVLLLAHLQFVAVHQVEVLLLVPSSFPLVVHQV